MGRSSNRTGVRGRSELLPITIRFGDFEKCVRVPVHIFGNPVTGKPLRGNRLFPNLAPSDVLQLSTDSYLPVARASVAKLSV